MTATKRVTKRDNYNALLALDEVQAKPELVEFINKQIELLDRKTASANGEKKLTATQVANNGTKSEILEFLTDNADKQYTISELQKIFADKYPEMSNQKLSALVRQLKDEGKVLRIEDKRKAYFKIA